MTKRLVSILDGNTFVVSDDTGDMEPSPFVPTGLIAWDTRFLSKWELTVDGKRLTSLSVNDLQHFETRYFLVPGAATHYIDAKVSVIRHRWLGASFHEQLTVINHDDEPTDLQLRVEMDSDFADLFEIKHQPDEKLGERSAQVEDGCLRLTYKREDFHREAMISSTAPAEIDEHGMSFTLSLAPQASWATELEVQTLLRGARGRDIRTGLRAYQGRAKPHLHQALEDWLANAPTLIADSSSLKRTYQRSLVDLGALRYVSLTLASPVLAAGLPWHMTLLGRNSLLTCLQAMPFTPEIALPTLQLLAAWQGTMLNDAREEEPGKILHEMRYGEKAAFKECPQSPYYGSADATPLFVILLDEYERWSGHADAVRDRYVWYQRRNPDGLENQGWKVTPDAITYRDGRVPEGPRATCELQGYAYDAKMRGARLARYFWGDPGYALELEREAAELKERFNRDFWVADGEYYALALDAEGGQVDALASNMGHLLWSGIVDPARASAVAGHLLGPRMFNGWGVRTLAEGEVRFNPTGAHRGAVWPFDNSFIARGLRRYRFDAEAAVIAQGILDAAGYFEGRLPTAFGGYDRALTKRPVGFLTANGPQAMSAGTPLLLVSTMLGLEPHEGHLAVEPELPAGIGHIELLDIPGRWGRVDAFGRGRLDVRPELQQKVPV
jgi:glycogen debranching enzyme